MRVRSGTATRERCPVRRGPSSARGESEWRSWERPAENPGPESGELCAPSPEPRHGSSAAVHSASRAQPAPAHLGGAKKKVVGRALLTRSVKEHTGTYMPLRGHSRAAVCAKVGLQPRQVIDWAEKRVVRPEIADPVGAGKPRLYSDDNMIEFVLANELVGVGLTDRGAARFLRFLKTRPPAFLRTIGGLRLARTRDGPLHPVGLSTFRER